jgi:hypothetical protein
MWDRQNDPDTRKKSGERGVIGSLFSAILRIALMGRCDYTGCQHPLGS